MLYIDRKESFGKRQRLKEKRPKETVINKNKSENDNNSNIKVEEKNMLLF